MSGETEVLVVGGGISGLALALALRERGVAVRVLEAAPAPGGNLRTRRVSTPEGEWLLDLGPNSFGDAAEEFMALVRRAGLDGELVRAPDEVSGRRWVWRAGRLREVPSNPIRFLLSPLLPLRGRLRLLKEPFVRPLPADAAEESLAEFCDRRLGRAAREKLLTPVVGGIYAGDPRELGAESSFPAMVALEREHGSLIRAAVKGHGPPSRGRLCSFRAGVGALPEAIHRVLGDAIVTGAAARRLDRDGAIWRVTTGRGDGFVARRVVLATPAEVTAALLAPHDPTTAAELSGIVYAPMAVVHVGLRRDAAGEFPPGFGFLVPRDEGLRILGAIFSSALFPGRAPEGHVLLSVFAGGRLDPSAAALPDAALRTLVLQDLATALGAGWRDSPLVEVTRWPRAIPQYLVGHKDRLARIDSALVALPGLHLLGNWRGGIAMPDCVRSANALARVLAPAGVGPAP